MHYLLRRGLSNILLWQWLWLVCLWFPRLITGRRPWGQFPSTPWQREHANWWGGGTQDRSRGNGWATHSHNISQFHQSDQISGSDLLCSKASWGFLKHKLPGPALKLCRLGSSWTHLLTRIKFIICGYGLPAKIPGELLSLIYATANQCPVFGKTQTCCDLFTKWGRDLELLPIISYF